MRDSLGGGPSCCSVLQQEPESRHTSSCTCCSCCAALPSATKSFLLQPGPRAIRVGKECNYTGSEIAASPQCRRKSMHIIHVHCSTAMWQAAVHSCHAAASLATHSTSTYMPLFLPSASNQAAHSFRISPWSNANAILPDSASASGNQAAAPASSPCCGCMLCVRACVRMCGWECVSVRAQAAVAGVIPILLGCDGACAHVHSEWGWLRTVVCVRWQTCFAQHTGTAPVDHPPLHKSQQTPLTRKLLREAASSFTT